MADAPNFKGIADGIVPPALVELVVDALRLAWNARGAADIVKLEAELSSMMGVSMSGPYVKNLDRALRSLDR